MVTLEETQPQSANISNGYSSFVAREVLRPLQSKRLRATVWSDLKKKKKAVTTNGSKDCKAWKRSTSSHTARATEDGDTEWMYSFHRDYTVTCTG